MDVPALPVEVVVSVGWLTTSRSVSSGVPANSFRPATRMVEIDWTALLGEPGMSTSRTVERLLSVSGRLSTAAPLFSRPPRLDSGPASRLMLSTRLCFCCAGRSDLVIRAVSSPMSVVVGSDGIRFSAEMPASDVLASAIVPTHGPRLGLQRACTWPLRTPTLSSASSGVLGGWRPPASGCGLSGIAVCDSAPGTCGESPSMAIPAGEDCATARS